MTVAERKCFKVPSFYQVPLEALGVIDAARLFLSRRKLAEAPRGNNQKVLVLPGYGTDDRYTAWLRKYLNSRGYRADVWGLGHNHGNVEFLLGELGKIVKQVYEAEQQKIILVGWSLGGYLARETARENQDKVERIVTLGSPVIGGPKYTAFAQAFDRQGFTLDELEREIDNRFTKPIDVPIFAIYSKRDNIVSWQACIDHYSPRVTHHEISSTHIGFMANPEAFIAVAEFLYRPLA